MGWWGHGLFSGDSPLDWQSHHIDDLGKIIDKIIDKDTSTYYDVEDAPAMIFYYADYSRRYTRRVGRLKAYAEWCKQYKAEGWRSGKEREEAVHRLGEEIEALFQDEKDGYKLDPNAPRTPVDIVGRAVYHLTTQKCKDAIAQEGLKPQECFAGFGKNITGIYVSDSMMGCLKWQFHVLSHRLKTEPVIIKFVIQKSDQVVPDLRVDFKDDFIVLNPIPPERLHIFD